MNKNAIKFFEDKGFNIENLLKRAKEKFNLHPVAMEHGIERVYEIMVQWDGEGVPPIEDQQLFWQAKHYAEQHKGKEYTLAKGVFEAQRTKINDLMAQQLIWQVIAGLSALGFIIIALWRVSS